MNKVCYIPLKGVDDVIAAHLGWKPTENFNPAYRVATLRGMYDESHESNLDTSDPIKAAKTLATFRGELARKNSRALSSTGTTLYSSYVQLIKNFTAEERFNRINMLASMFSRVVDRMRAAGPSKSREEYIKGFVKNGQLVAGELRIFEQVYSELIDKQAHYMSLGTQEGKEKAAKVKQILDNWPAITAFVRMKLRDTEGIKLGNKLDWADEANDDNFGDNVISELFDASESTRESWQEVSDMQSSFGNLSKGVRRFLSCCPEYKDGKVQYDDLGHPIMLDPVRIHQTLMGDLRGITSETQMMRAFFNKEGKLKHEWLKSIVQTLRTDNRLRTQFFVDFSKNFQPYSSLTRDKDFFKKGLKVFKVALLNKVENLLEGEFMTRVQLGTPINKANSVFNAGGSINWEKLQEVRSRITEWLNPGPLKVPKWKHPKTERLERRAFLLEVSEALGMPVDADVIEAIMGNPQDLKSYLANLKEALIYGIDSNLTKEIFKKLEAGDYSVSKRSYKSLLTAKNSAKGSLKEKIDNMLTLITKNREGLRLEATVRVKNAKGKTVTLSSDVNPSYMGEMFKRIKSYVDNNDKDNFRKFLENNYLSSSYFRDANGNILNKWLEELYKCCDKDGPELSETFANDFVYMKDLGSVDTVFENFTSKQHLISMITRFFSDTQISDKATTAQYPVFIMGDSGVSKYIRAKLYSSEEILNGMYKVWRQEKRRMMLEDAANKKLESDGYKGIDNFSDRKVEVKRDDNGKVIDVVGEYTMLPFLNEPKYARLLGSQSEAEVKAAIRTYLDDAYAKFKLSLRNMDMLETVDITVTDSKTGKTSKEKRYKYLPKNITPSENDEKLDKELQRFYWNTKFATIQQLQLMTIDTAFYKGTKDLQKRYKEIHAPGESISLEALDRDGKRYSEDGFERCIYFDDIVLSSAETNSKFLEAIKKRIKRKDAWGKYLENTLTDGQGYRTLRSYRKVLGMAGKWTDEMENAFREIESIKSTYQKGKIPAEELKRIADLAVVFQPIKPYMFTHETYPINDKDKLFIPVQHKYAEAVLIPELLPEGSMLRDMAYYMDENNIDLVGSTKIVKVGCFGSTNIKGVKNAEELNDALSKGYVHKLSYSDYRIQTNVPDHVQSARLFGTQLRKLIMAGIKMDEADDGHYSSYVDFDSVNLGGNHGNVKINGRNLVSFWNSLIVANIIESQSKFVENTKDVEKLSEQLIQAVINNSRESTDNILSYGIIDDDFAVPLFEAGLEHDSSALLLSIFKKMVNKQTIQGNPLVQVSAMGISGYAEDGDLQYVTDDNDNILYAECEIPWDLSYVEKDENGNDRVVPLDFNDYCNEDGTLKLGKDGIPLIEKKLPGVTSMVAYRIPTERDYSMINLKVKRFSQKAAGGTIKVPPEGTTIAGFDFDVDKLYLMRREYRAKKKQSTDEATDNLLSAIFGQDTSELLEFEEYDPTKPPMSYKTIDEKTGKEVWVQGNTKAARNNMLIDLIQKRLMDPETFEQRYTPGGFINASKAARVMRELLFGNLSGIVKNGEVDFSAIDERIANEEPDPEPNYDPSDPMTIITYNQQNQVAGKLIGIFANQNTNHAFASLMKTFRLIAPIEFAGHSYGDGRLSDFLHAPEGVDSDLNVAEFLSASVDAVKDPVLNFMNLNTITANAGAVLARIGYTTQEIGILFNQPIIKEICDYCLNNNVGIETAIRDKRAEYLKVEGVKDPRTTNPSDFTIEKLAGHIIKDRTSREAGNNAMHDPSFLSEQLKVLSLFTKISSVADEVTQFVTSTKFTASNAVGSTFGDLYAQQMRVSNYIRNVGYSKNIVMQVTDEVLTPLDISYDLLDMSNIEYLDAIIDSTFAYEQAMYDANRKALRHLSKFFPYDNDCYTGARVALAALTKSGTLDADTINSLHSDLMAYLLANEEHSDFNGELPKLGTGHTRPDGTAPTVREYYTKYFAGDLYRELEANPEFKELAIFKYMIFDVNEQGNVTVNIQGVGGLKSFQKDEIRESWADLNRTHPLVARDLFLYNFYKLGFQFSPHTFMNLAPTEVKLSLKVPDKDGNPRSYIDFLKEVRNDSIKYDIVDFVVQYMLNHTDNTKLVFNADKSEVARNYLSKKAFNSLNEANQSFEIDISELGDDAGLFLSSVPTKKDPTAVFRPVISYRGALFVAQMGNLGFSTTNGTKMTYVRKDQQGSKGVSMSYTGNTPIERVLDTEETDEGFFPGNSSQEPGPAPATFDREAAITEIATEMAKALEKIDYRDNMGELISAQSLIEGLRGASDAELQSQIEDIRKACRKDGILLMDNEGNLLEGC